MKMPDIKNGFSIDIKYGDHTEKQNFRVAEGDDALCLYLKDSKNALMMLETKNHEFTIDNSSHQFDAISKDNVIILKDVSNIQIKYNTDFTITADTEQGKRTFKITHNEISMKIGKNFESIAKFDKPLDVSLPYNLPKQIKNKDIIMTDFPSQMLKTLRDSYGYDQLTFENGVNILKSPDGEILYQDGTKIISANKVEMRKNEDGNLVTFLPRSELTKPAENRISAGTRLSKNDAKNLSEFLGLEYDEEKIKEFPKEATFTSIKSPKNTYRIARNKISEEQSQAANTNAQPSFNIADDNQSNNEIADVNKPELSVDENEQDDNTQAQQETNDPPQTQDVENTTDNPDDNSNGNPTDPAHDFRIDENVSPNKQSEQDDDKSQKHEQPPKTPEASPAQNNNNNNQVGAENNKKSDEKLEAEKNKAASQAMHKGLRIILLILGANFFMAGFMLANPAFILVSLMCLFGMTTSWVAQTSKFRFSSIFSIGKDIKDYVKAKQNIKQLTPSQQRKYEKLMQKSQSRLTRREQEKLNSLIRQLKNPNLTKEQRTKKEKQLEKLENKKNGTKPLNEKELNEFDALRKKKLNGDNMTKKELERYNKLNKKQEIKPYLSQHEQDKFDYYDTRVKNKLSHAEYKQDVKNNHDLGNRPASKKLEEMTKFTEQQNINFELSRQEELQNIDFEIKSRQDFLEKTGEFINENVTQTIQKDIKNLESYKQQVKEMENTTYKDNKEFLDVTAKQLKENPDQKWLSTDKDISRKTFTDLATENNINSPKMSISTKELVDSLPKLKSLKQKKEAKKQQEPQISSQNSQELTKIK